VAGVSPAAGQFRFRSRRIAIYTFRPNNRLDTSFIFASRKSSAVPRQPMP
jgi:hypothetical protein